MQCPRCHHENRPSAKFCDGCGTPLQGPSESATPALSYADVQLSLTNSLQQQTATSEILRVISQSPTDVQPVFDAIANSAVRICGAAFSGVFRFDGRLLHLTAHAGLTAEELEAGQRIFPARALPGGIGLSRVVLDRTVVHIADIRIDVEWQAALGRHTYLAPLDGYRTFLAVPLLHGDVCLGAINVWRREVSPFSEQQTELLKTFAAQAVIAIENVRLFNETKDALERQTATSEILQVISSSPTDVQPVFNAILESATRLCGANVGHLFQFDGELLSLVAQHNSTPEMDEAIQRFYPMRPSRGQVSGRAILNRTVVHIPDVFNDHEYRSDVAGTVGWRSRIGIPLLRDGNPIGVIVINRTEPGSFADNHITLLQTFANQAVIAIENVRLFNETKEALDQQTATAEILRVIASSPTDVQPVFDAIADAAMRLCGAHSSLVTTFDGELLHLVAQADISPEGREVVRDVYPRRPSRGSASGRTVMTRAIVEIPDVTADPEYDVQVVPRVRDFRSILAVPMLRDGLPIGTINAHKAQPGPFTDKQIELLKTFADQAVIAIENARLFTELQEKNRALTKAHAQVSESLERQTATSEILRVISQSPTDAQPVFETIVRNAVRLCGAVNGGVYRFDGELIHSIAHEGFTPEQLEDWRRHFPRRITTPGIGNIARAITTRSVQKIADIEAADLGEDFVANLRTRGVRSTLGVPMIRQDEVIGVIGLTHRAVDGFSDAHIALLKTFADQAVIAIENVRLFTELQEKNKALTQAHAYVTEALDRQTATSDILRAISASPVDVQPVFEAIGRNAVRLCNGVMGAVFRFDGEFMHIGALHGYSAEGEEATRQAFPTRPERRMLAGRAVLSRAIVHVPDVTADPEFEYGALASMANWRSLLVVPMLREGKVLGTVGVSRAQAGPFTDQEIALLHTFADQAVIAIENARLFKELQTRNGELTEALDQQTATSAILRVISGTQRELQPVFDTIVQSAARLCNATIGAVFQSDGRTIYNPASSGEAPDALAAVRSQWPRPVDMGTMPGMALLTRSVVHFPDVEQSAIPEPVQQVGRLLRFRSVVAVPMLRETEAVGVLVVARREPGRFSDAEVALLQTFADQAVIAIENVRLFKELEAANHELAAASQHKSEFLANMSHELRTPLNAIIGFSEVLTDRMFGELNEKQGEYLKDIYASGTHLLSLINDILDLSKIEAGRMELELSNFHLPTALDNALTLVRERAGRRNIALHTRIDDRLGQMQGDERKIRQVVLNLLSNAIKFTPEGGRIEVTAVPKDGFVEVSVSDTGVGIAPEDQEKVFEEFRQVGTADKKAEGTGLGLTLCRKFIELHGGKIWVKSEVGVGSTFTFSLSLSNASPRM